MKQLPNSKTCKDCKAKKPISAFYTLKLKYSTKKGVKETKTVASYCKECFTIRTRSSYIKKYEEFKAYRKEYYLKNKGLNNKPLKYSQFKSEKIKVSPTMKPLPKKKVCKICHVEKVISAFNILKVKRVSKTGLIEYTYALSYCKKCHSIRTQNDNKKRGEKYLKYQQNYRKEYQVKNRERLTAKIRKYTEENREKINALRRLRYHEKKKLKSESGLSAHSVK
jgi:hypothetical protein